MNGTRRHDVRRTGVLEHPVHYLRRAPYCLGTVEINAKDETRAVLIRQLEYFVERPAVQARWYRSL